MKKMSVSFILFILVMSAFNVAYGISLRVLLEKANFGERGNSSVFTQISDRYKSVPTPSDSRKLFWGEMGNAPQVTPEEFCNGKEQELENILGTFSFEEKYSSPIGRYKLNGDNLTYMYGVNKKEHLEGLRKYLQITEPGIRKKISYLHVDSSWQSVSGQVFYDDNERRGLKEVTLHLSEGLINKLDFPSLVVYVHELGHVVVMTDFSPNKIEKDKCDGYFNPKNGCAKSGTLLGDWYLKFWKPFLSSQIDIDTNKEFQKSLATKYAGKDVLEDIAETFAHWILDHDVLDEQPMVRIKYKEFFEKDPKFVEYKRYIREKLPSSDFCKKK